MDKELKQLLEGATGSSEFVIAVYVDVRGFSSFSQTVDSLQAAEFITKVYMKLMDEFFPEAAFYKSAGDGLLIVMPYTKEDLREVAGQAVRSSVRLLDEFASLCDDDPMINFEVPQKVGIGISRGSACRIESGDRVLDYAGRVLNLAARCMDYARPSGIVFDVSFGVDLVPDEIADMFERESVSMRGIAERELIDIYCTKDYTRIPVQYKEPIEGVKWKTLAQEQPLSDIRQFPRFIFDLPSKPLDPDEIVVKISHDTPAEDGGKLDGYLSSFSVEDFEYFVEAGKPIVRLLTSNLTERLANSGVEDAWVVKIEIMYPE